MKLVVIALMLDIPLAFFMTKSWLQDFAYRIELTWTIFIAAGIATITIALLTVCFQSIKAAIANPVNSLRSE